MMVQLAKFLKTIIVLAALLISADNIIAQTTASDVVHLFKIDANLKAPLRLAIDASDNIYVSDAKTKEVLKYDSSGTLLANYVTGGSAVSLAVNSDDQVFIGEEEGQILIMNANGTTSLFYSDSIYPSDMAFSPDNLLYIVDSRSKQVLVLDVSGNLIPILWIKHPCLSLLVLLMIQKMKEFLLESMEVCQEASLLCAKFGYSMFQET